jgi:hypothetical protein
MRALLQWLLVALLLGIGASSTAMARPPKPPVRRLPPPGPELEAGINWNPPEDRVRTLHDFETIDVRAALQQFRSENRALIGSVVPRQVSVPAALAAARAAVDPEGKGALLAALRARAELQTPAALRAYAAVAFLNARPGVALGALLVGEERQPGNPGVRFDLAGLMAWSGLVNEADALLADLVASGQSPGHAFGITAEQGVTYLRSYIQMRQGKTAEAMAGLRPIAAANPYFSEALLSLALMEAEAGQDAQQHFLMGVFRRPVPPPGTTATAGAGADTPATTPPSQPDEAGPDDAARDYGLDASLFVDLSKGLPGELPPVRTPKGLPERLAYVDWLQAQGPALTADAMALLQARDQARQRWGRKQLPRDLRDRLVAIERMIDPANARLAEIRRLNRAIDGAIVDKTEATARLNEKFMNTWVGLMPAYIKDPASVATQVKELAESLDETMQAQVQLVDEYTRRRDRIWHRYATALGALTGDADFQAYLAAQIKVQEQVDYHGLVTNMAESCTFSRQAFVLARRCFMPPERLGDGVEKTADTDTAKCTEDQKSRTLGVEGETGAGLGKISDISVSAEANCDGFSLEVSGMFAETVGVSAELEFKTDKTCTLYLGPKLSQTTGIGLTGSKELSTKTGLYLTMDSKSFTDVGVKTNIKETAKLGALGFNVTASHTLAEGPPISFIPGPQAPERGQNGLLIFNGQPH